MQPSEAPMLRNIRAARSGTTRLHTNTSRMRGSEAGPHRDISPLLDVIARAHGDQGALQRRNALVQRGCARLHRSYANVHRD
jgi:hypothetical protein